MRQKSIKGFQTGGNMVNIMNYNSAKAKQGLSVLFSVSAMSAMLVMSGCSLNTADNSEFTCASKINGVCGSPMQVYKMTNGSLPEEPPAKPTNIENGVNSYSQTTNETEAKPQSVASVLKEHKQLKPVTGSPVPLREPARVMRIWVAPWVESKTDALHWPSYIYVEVEARKWSMGLKDFKGMKAGIPLVQRTNPANLPPDGATETPAQSQGSEGGEGGEGNRGESSFFPSFN
jgi:conjugal transfer pilus assembly protein TraV